VPRPRRHRSPDRLAAGAEPLAPLRIIGGALRGRKIGYSGDPRTRPMKDRIREAIFSRLGTSVAGTHAVDLFAGTGALGIEALSRGAAGATFVEQHFPTADLLQRTLVDLGLADRARVVPADVVVWAPQLELPAEIPWLVFVSPPWSMFVERRADLWQLVRFLMRSAPPRSVQLVEAGPGFDAQDLPAADQWSLSAYSPAVVATWTSPDIRPSPP
jgi:16S rRNA (guanine966-N2)-methyltransferase